MSILKINALAPLEYRIAREILRGIRAYAMDQKDWSLRCGSMLAADRFPDAFGPTCELSGTILFISDETMAEVVQRSAHFPVVNVSGRLGPGWFPRVTVDNWQVGRVAAEHLLLRGFERFACSYGTGSDLSRGRSGGFAETLRDAGFPCLDTTLHASDLAELTAKMKQLEPPIGVLASDREAALLIEACIDAGINVPDQLAVVGVDDDELFCISGPITISSIDTRGYDIGYRAAEMLDQLIAGQDLPSRDIRVPCGSVVVRKSTDTMVAADHEVAKAARYIRRHACEGLGVDQVVAQISIARRTLEKRFSQVFGRTLHSEIRRVQMHHACNLLTQTQKPIGEIAEQVGFCNRHHFYLTFRKNFGLSPSAYRNEQIRASNNR